MKRDDLFYFEQAMILARGAFKNGYSPVGAVLVAADECLSLASSRREIGNPFHAEFLAMLEMANLQIVPDAPITLYSTLEPCVMCIGMAAVMRVAHIKWLVDDVWAGTLLLNYNMPYVQKRFPTMDKLYLTGLHQEAKEMWVKYLRSTGHADAVAFMLGLSEDDQCKYL